MICNVSRLYKEKIQNNGFNVVSVRWINGRKLICIAVYLERYDNSIQGVITSIEDHQDEYNGILMTVSYGSKLSPEETKAFFPNLDESIKAWKKIYPKHFLINE